MSLSITDDAITLAGSKHSARRGEGGWVLSWLPDRMLDGNQAISGMTLAETAGTDAVSGPSRWLLLDTLAAELRLTGAEAVGHISAAEDRYDRGSTVADEHDDAEWDDGYTSVEALIPAAIAIGLPIALTRISLLAAVLSLLVSAVLLFLAKAIHHETGQRQAQAVHAEQVLAQLTGTGGGHGDR